MWTLVLCAINAKERFSTLIRRTDSYKSTGEKLQTMGSHFRGKEQQGANVGRNNSYMVLSVPEGGQIKHFKVMFFYTAWDNHGERCHLKVAAIGSGPTSVRIHLQQIV